MPLQDHAADLPDATVRQRHPFDRERFADLVRYICWICEDPRVLGLDRLSRILWYVDRSLYLTRDRVATGASYLRHRNGPLARPLAAVLHELERAGLIAQRARVGEGKPDLLVSLSKPGLGRFEPEEISLVEAVTRAICFDPRATIPERDAHDVVLQAARPGEVVPYFSVFAGRSGQPGAGDLAWAIRESGRSHGKPASLPRTAAGSRESQAVEALLWHLLRDPALGMSLPGTAISWFVHKQHAVPGCGASDLTVLYRFEADELVLGGLRRTPAGHDGEDEDEDGDEPG